MKPIMLKGDYKLWTVTQTQFAQIVGVSQPRINQMLEESMLFRDDSSKNGALFLIDSLRSYYSIKLTNKNAKGEDKVEDAAVDFWQERAKNEKAKRELNELKLSKARGELYDAATVESIVAESLTNFKNKLLGIPTKIAPQLAGKSIAQINQLLTLEIEENLNELAGNLEGADFNEELPDTAEVDGAGIEDAAANHDNAMGKSISEVAE